MMKPIPNAMKYTTAKALPSVRRPSLFIRNSGRKMKTATGTEAQTRMVAAAEWESRGPW
jgi:hypothetical protein